MRKYDINDLKNSAVLPDDVNARADHAAMKAEEVFKVDGAVRLMKQAREEKWYGKMIFTGIVNGIPMPVGVFHFTGGIVKGMNLMKVYTNSVAFEHSVLNDSVSFKKQNQKTPKGGNE